MKQPIKLDFLCGRRCACMGGRAIFIFAGMSSQEFRAGVQS